MFCLYKFRFLLNVKFNFPGILVYRYGRTILSHHHARGFCSNLQKKIYTSSDYEKLISSDSGSRYRRLLKVWCLVRGYVVSTPTLFVKTLRRDIISRWKNTKSFYCSLSSLIIHFIICAQIHVILNLLHWCGSKK